MAVHHLTALSLSIGGGSAAKPPRRRRGRRPRLADQLNQAKAAGVSVAAATVAPDGTVSLTFGQPAEVKGNGRDKNEWDEVLNNGAGQEHA
jgi:hypothetical protein